jgi:hypothetical protein
VRGTLRKPKLLLQHTCEPRLRHLTATPLKYLLFMRLTVNANRPQHFKVRNSRVHRSSLKKSPEELFGAEVPKLRQISHTAEGTSIDLYGRPFSAQEEFRLKGDIEDKSPLPDCVQHQRDFYP